MSSSSYRNTSPHDVELADGRMLPPGEDADVDPKDDDGVHAHLIHTGQLTRVQEPKGPAADPKPKDGA